jgi:hypothetical protein
MKGIGSDEGPSDPGTNLTDDQSLPTLEISPFASVCQIARMTLLRKTRMSWRLTESLNFMNKKLRWAPDSLSEEQKRMPVEKSQAHAKRLDPKAACPVWVVLVIERDTES